MSVSLASWLQPIVFHTSDDREFGEILACQEITNLGQAYEFLYAAWQNPSALNLFTSLEVLSVLQHLYWLEEAEAQAWLEFFAYKTWRSFPASKQFLYQLEQDGLEPAPLQRLKSADFTNWEAGFSLNLVPELASVSLISSKNDLPLPPELQVNSSPLGFALAVRASSFVVYQQDVHSAASLRRKFWPDVKLTLNEYWQVHSQEDCVQLLYWLAGQGQRYAWQLDAAWLDEATPEDKQIWLQELPADQQDYAHLLQQQPPAWQPDLAAWDWVRMADLALAGFLAGYLDAQQWQSFALTAVWLLAQKYTSWQEIAHSYLLGYEFWQTQTDFSLSSELESTWRNLLACPFSPMRQLDWGQLDLQDPSFQQALASFSAGLKDSMLPSLLASLRDDTCLLTGLNPESLDAERSQDAQEFVTQHLEISPLESLSSGLVRFWQPGLVHHYDQLAHNCLEQKKPQLPPNLAAIPEVKIIWQQQLTSLAALHQQPAAVVMAEKYAFNLLKAQESQAFCQQEVLELNQALVHYLSWHYSSARQLLTAWQKWDAVLSDSLEAADVHEKSLAPELHWHLHDPGSLFNFLPWPAPQQSFLEPGPRLSEQELALLNLVGPLTGIHWSWPEILPETPAEEIKQFLAQNYYLNSAADLTDYLDFLYKSGDRQDFLINFAPFTTNQEQLNTEINTYAQQERNLDDEGYYQRLLQVKYNTLGINDVDLIAWDMCQLVDLAVTGYQIGWLIAAELKHWLQLVAAKLKPAYAGWDSFSGALLAGYNFFMPQDESKEQIFNGFSQRLLSLLIAVPPQVGLWYTLTWPGAVETTWGAGTSLLPNAKLKLH